MLFSLLVFAKAETWPTDPTPEQWPTLTKEWPQPKVRATWPTPSREWAKKPTEIPPTMPTTIPTDIPTGVTSSQEPPGDTTSATNPSKPKKGLSTKQILSIVLPVCAVVIVVIAVIIVVIYKRRGKTDDSSSTYMGLLEPNTV